MNKELKQTLLTICQKYDIRCNTAPYAPETCMLVTGKGAEVRMDASEVYTWKPGGTSPFKHIHIELRIWLGGAAPIYKDCSDVNADQMLARASGVPMPSIDTKSQDLLDVYIAMRNKLDEQRRAEEVMESHKLRALQRAFDIQVNEKNTNVR